MAAATLTYQITFFPSITYVTFDKEEHINQSSSDVQLRSEPWVTDKNQYVVFCLCEPAAISTSRSF